MSDYYDFVLSLVDGTPDHTFVEVEDDHGNSVGIESIQWMTAEERGDSLPAIRFHIAAVRGDGEPANCIHAGCNRQGEHEHDGGVDARGGEQV